MFVILDSVNKGFAYPIHNHPEFELTLVMGGSGNRIVGDSTASYDDVDLVLLGPFLFHKWDDEYRQGTDENPCRVITIQFDMHLFDKSILAKKPFASIQKLLMESSRGVRFYGNARLRAIEKITELVSMTGIESVTSFLMLLDLLSQSNEAEYLASEGFKGNPVQVNSKRLHAAYQYMLNHFQDSNMRMSDVAAVVNLGDSAFSHFFKKATNRSYSDYVIAMRIEYACKLLIETDEQISTIAFMSGFNNLANFNRLFKVAHQCTPIRFRKLFNEKNKFDYSKQQTPGQFMPPGIEDGINQKPAEYSTRIHRA